VEERPLTFSLDEENQTLHVSGEVDELSGPALREALDKNSAGYTQRLVVDLGDVDFLPSAGVGVLAVAMRNAEEHGGRIELVAPKGTIAQQVLNICGLPHRHD
jgi:anti-anti-sigma factor